MKFQRNQVRILKNRLEEVPRFITIVAGPRQVGKTTLVRQAIDGIGHQFVSVDPSGEPRARSFDLNAIDTMEAEGAPRNAAWLIRTWQAARAQCEAFKRKYPERPFVFVLDEIQKITRWPDTVKGLWDADRAQELPMHVVLLGSSPLLIQKGLTESLTGRYELIRASHWSFVEMHQAFDFTLNEYIYFGGYPGSASLIRDEERWRNYVLASLVQPSIDTDILQMARVDKPALLKQLFTLGAIYSGQILALGKVKGQLQDHAGRLFRSAGQCRPAHRLAKVPRRCRTQARFCAQVQCTQHRPHVQRHALYLCPGTGGSQLLGALGGKYGGSTPVQYGQTQRRDQLLARKPA